MEKLKLFLVAGSFLALVVLVPLDAQEAIAADPCFLTGAPTCDGECPPGDACVEIATDCVCMPATGPCGLMAGPPLCYGDCPAGLACFDKGFPIGCECDVVPTLSEWGIMGMSLLMFGGVMYLRRRRETVQRS